MHSILHHLKEHVMKIKEENTWRRFSNFKKDQEHIAGLQAKLNALVSMFYIFTVLCHLIQLIIQINFQAFLSGEESSQEASKPKL